MSLVNKILFEATIPNTKPEFWSELDVVLQNINAKNASNLVYDFLEKWEKLLRCNEESQNKLDDYLCDLHNINKIKKVFTFGQWLYLLLIFYEYGGFGNLKINSAFIQQNKSITAYKGVTKYSLESQLERLAVEGTYSSFTTSQEVAKRFCRPGWGNMSFMAGMNSNKGGTILVTQIPIQSIHIFNDVGGEKELIIKTPIKIIKKIKI